MDREHDVRSHGRDSPSVKTPDARDILKRQRQRLASMLGDVPEEAGDFTDDEMVE